MNNPPNRADAGAAQAPAEAEILPPQAASAAQPLCTEALLDTLIEECRRLVREVATPSMAAMTDPLERRLFMQSAVSFIEAGAKVGDTVARLRSGGVQSETRHRVFVEHVTPPLAPLRTQTRSLLEEDDEEEWGEGDRNHENE
ncbi:MAG TPA: hypothetical protein VGC27_06745 [Rhizomicrobium sp.]